MTYDIAFRNGLPVCLRPEPTKPACDGCYGLGYDGDGKPLCMAAVRDVFDAVEALWRASEALRGK